VSPLAIGLAVGGALIVVLALAVLTVMTGPDDYVPIADEARERADGALRDAQDAIDGYHDCLTMARGTTARGAGRHRLGSQGVRDGSGR
jgi:hypothetical protein